MNSRRLVFVLLGTGAIACGLTIYAGAQIPSLVRQREDLESNIAARQVDLKESEGKIKTKQSEIAALEEQIKVLREQAHILDRIARIDANAPIEAQLTPRADTQDYDAKQAKAYKEQFGKDVKNYRMWLDGPPEVLSEIAKVTFVMNHPSFKPPFPESDDPKKQFLVEYFGYGCLRNVIVKLELKDGKVKQLDFNQCGAITAWRTNVGQSN